MSHWNGHEIVRWPPKRIRGHPGWIEIDCGCCNGLQWGGEEPRECKDCGGSGVLCLHRSSGRLADYPGGPFRGRIPVQP